MYSLLKRREIGSAGWTGGSRSRAALEPLFFEPDQRNWRGGLGIVGTAAVLALFIAFGLIHTAGRWGDGSARVPNPVSQAPGAPARVVIENDHPLAPPADFAATVEEALPAAIPTNPPPTEARVDEPTPAPIVAETPRPAEEPPVTQAAREPEPDHASEPLATASVPTRPVAALREAARPAGMSSRRGVRARAAPQIRAAAWKEQTRGPAARPARPVSVRSAHAGKAAPAIEARAWSLPRALMPTTP